MSTIKKRIIPFIIKPEKGLVVAFNLINVKLVNSIPTF